MVQVIEADMSGFLFSLMRSRLRARLGFRIPRETEKQKGVPAERTVPSRYPARRARTR